MQRKKYFLKVLFAAGVVCTAIFCSHKLVFSKIFDESYFRHNINDLKIVVGDLDTIWTKDLTRIAIANPAIADVIETKPTEALVTAKTPGKTEVYIWDAYGKRTVTVWVFAEDLDLVEARVAELLKSADIQDISLEKSELEGKLVISGEVEEKQKKAFDALVEPFAASLVNLVKEREKKELVEFDMQISELSSTYAKNLGIEWTTSESDGSYIFDETALTGNVKDFGDIFKIGKMTRTSTIQAKINALITEGKGKILSQPKIVVKSGEEASFSVGGEVPIRTTTTSSGGSFSENITFHDYGVDLKIKSVVEKSGKIDIDLNVDVSDIDESTKVGSDVGYTKRSAQTKLYLDSGQTIILAGFIKDSKGVNVKRVPLLGSLPIIGIFFRSQSNDPNAQTELFISLTPRVVQTNEKKQQEGDEAKKESKVQEEKNQSVIASLAKTETDLPQPTYQPIAVPGIMAEYIRSVQEHIAKNIFYPQFAKDTKAQGAVEVALTIITTGSLVTASVS